MNAQLAKRLALVGCLALLLSSCTGQQAIPTQPPQPPDEYLSNALDWIETHSVKIKSVDWAAIREQALALAAAPRTTADTYPAMLFLMKQLGDSATFFIPPDDLEKESPRVGIGAFYPEAVIVGIHPAGPAEAAGLRTGDVIEAINGLPPQQWQGTRYLDWYDDESKLEVRVHRPGQDERIAVMLDKMYLSDSPPRGRRIGTDQAGVGYIEPPQAGGDWESYPTLVQQAIREADWAGTCGWLIDLRRNAGGNIWYYIAGLGPILGEGQLGGFVYPDGRREVWEYKDGKVLWNGEERAESLVEGAIYRLKQPMPPVAVLISSGTLAAGELAALTFRGRPGVRTFGEATGGSPFLVYHTRLADGAFLGVSGAFSMDRTGRIYDGPIQPDEIVPTDWALFGTDRDPVVKAATDWLLSQPQCRHE